MSEHQETGKVPNIPKQDFPKQGSALQKQVNTSGSKVASFTPQETPLSQTFAKLGQNPPDDGFSKSREAMKNYNTRNATQQMPGQFSSVVPTSQGTIQKLEDGGIKTKEEEKKVAQKKEGGQAQTSGGSTSSGAMPDAVKGKMESAFQTDFSDVKIHSNSSKSTEMGALAYAQGNEVHFAPGQYKPETKEGQELLGHELTHVVQQREGRVKATTQAKGVPVNDDPALEKEADEMGKKVAQQKNVATGRQYDKSTTAGKYLQKKATDQEALDKIAPQQAIYEFAAHHLVYKQENYSLSDQEESFLNQNGYGISEKEILWYGQSIGAKLGFQAVLLKSIKSGQNDLLAVRGTVPGGGSEELMTIYSDLDPRAVGMKQFEENKALIEGIISTAGGAVDVTGHSLGGAMAQHIAVNFSGQVANVSTFQSPGIDQTSVDKFNQIPKDKRPKAVHHIVTGDIVDKAGEASLPGDVFEHNFGGELNVNTLLSTVTGHVGNIKEGITKFNSAIGDITSITGRLVTPNLTVYSDWQTLNAKIAEIGSLKQEIGSEISALRAYLAETGKTVGDAHGTHVFSSAHSGKTRDQIGSSKVAFDTKMNRPSTVSKHENYPHSDQRAVAEPIRQNLGGKVLGLFKAYIQLVKTYEKTVECYNSFKQGASNAWGSFKDGVGSTLNSVQNRVDNVWNWITN